MKEIIIGVDGEKWNRFEVDGEVMICRNTDHIKYKQVGKLWFHEETPTAVCKALNTAYTLGTKVKLYQGDIKTGRVWPEEWDTIGTIGRSTGERKIPLLIVEGEHGGPGILDHCLVAIKDMNSGGYMYIAKNYQPPVVTIVPSTEVGYKYSTIYNGELHGNHKTIEDALQTRDILL